MATSVEVIKALSPSFITCRYARHAWYPIGMYRVDEGPVSVLQCSRCGSTREDFLKHDGSKEGNHYIYTSGYVLQKTDDKITVSEKNRLVRKEMISRMKEYQSRSEMVKENQ